MSKMTVGALKEYLADKPDEAMLEFSVKAYTQAYPSFYLTIEDTKEQHKYQHWLTFLQDTRPQRIRFELHTPEGISIHKKK